MLTENEILLHLHQRNDLHIADSKELEVLSGEFHVSPRDVLALVFALPQWPLTRGVQSNQSPRSTKQHRRARVSA